MEFQVCVECFTYNQAQYINDALDGFCIQETSFPYVCVIVDDDSTDGEQSVIEQYFVKNFDLEDKQTFRNENNKDYSLTFAKHKTNVNCFFAVLYLKYNHYSIRKTKRPYFLEWIDNSKYTALCEGDDYWIDPLKLQKQYELMELHPDYSMCFHPNYRLYNNGEKTEHYPRIKRNFYGTKETILLGGAMMATNSMFFQRCFFPDYQSRPDFWKNALIGDVPLRLYLSTKGGIGYINEIMSVYRKQSVGSWTVKNRTLRSWIKHNIRTCRMWREFNKYTKSNYFLYIELKLFINWIVFLRGVGGIIKMKIS